MKVANDRDRTKSRWALARRRLGLQPVMRQSHSPGDVRRDGRRTGAQMKADDPPTPVAKSPGLLSSIEQLFVVIVGRLPTRPPHFHALAQARMYEDVQPVFLIGGQRGIERRDGVREFLDRFAPRDSKIRYAPKALDASAGLPKARRFSFWSRIVLAMSLAAVSAVGQSFS